MKKIIISNNTKISITFNEIFLYRDLLYFLVLKEITILYKQTILGFSWAIIRPFMNMVIFTIIFGKIANIPSDGVPYPIFSFVALVPWTFFSTSLTKSSNSLLSNVGLFTKVYFPRIFIPITPIIASLLDFFIALIIVFLMMFWFNIYPNSNIIYLPYLIMLMFLTSAGLGMFFSSLAIQYRDVRHGITFLSQMLMYAAPVAWPVTLMEDKLGDSITFWYSFYPMVGVIEGFRSCLLGTISMPWIYIINGTVASILIFFFGAYFYTKKEKIIADVF